ncbi:MAG: hypothetical protein IPN18_14335 [Ignavibacteriales bacterium]|nr:hypothetical protein [Ignavibacteriales bacterium]
MSNTTEFKKWYSESFKKFEESLNGETKLPLHQTRKTALEEFQNAKFPTVKDEEWKYTNVSSLLNHKFVDVIGKSFDNGNVDLEKYLFNKEKLLHNSIH